VGQQLADSEPRLVAAAASMLEELDALAAPAADALARCMDEAPRSCEPGPDAGGPPPWIRQWPDGRPALGPAPKSLARIGDRRALPALAWGLEQPVPPRDIADAIGALGEPATSLVPLLRQRLREVPLDERLYDRCDPLVSAIAALAGYTDAVAPAVPEVLRVLRNPPARHREWTLLTAARSLGRIGPAAREAVPDLTALLGDVSHRTAIAAASALWRIEPGVGADAVLPVLHRYLVGPARITRAAVQAIAEIGPAAARAKPRLRGLLTVSEPWLRLDAAVALWRVTGDSAATLPVLRASWRDHVNTRLNVARCAAEIGPAAAALGPLLSRELVAVRRHNYSESGYGGHDIPADLRLLEFCRQALSRLGGHG
jgi:HEAT repeat protein